jgi:hypothetical protein
VLVSDNLLVAFAVVGVLALVLRWAYPRDRPPPAAFHTGEDYGLLTEIVSDASVSDGRRFVALLRDAGIRATMTTDRAGRARILVFPADEDDARRVVGWP